MKIEYVLDSSALLAFLHREPGDDVVKPALATAAMSAVNVSEVVCKLLAIPTDLATALATFRSTGVEVVPFDYGSACETAALLSPTKSLGLSLGDRACIALARRSNVPVLTADRAWKKLASKLSVDIRVIR